MDGTLNLARAAIQSNVKKFIFVSSSTVHGPNFVPRPHDEATVCEKPVTHYGRSKLQAEREILKLTQDKSMSVSILRPGVFYGLRPSPNLQQLMSLILNKKFVPCFGSEGYRRTYVNIEQVVDSLIFLSQQGQHGEAYLIGDESPLTTAELYQAITNGLGVKYKTLNLPTLCSRFAEKTALLMGSKANIHLKVPNALGEFGRDHYFTSTKIKSLGFPVSKNSLTGIQSMAEKFLNNTQSN